MWSWSLRQTHYIWSLWGTVRIIMFRGAFFHEPSSTDHSRVHLAQHARGVLCSAHFWCYRGRFEYGVRSDRIHDHTLFILISLFRAEGTPQIVDAFFKVFGQWRSAWDTHSLLRRMSELFISIHIEITDNKKNIEDHKPYPLTYRYFSKFCASFCLLLHFNTSLEVFPSLYL